MSDDIADRIANNLGNTFMVAAMQTRADSANLAFLGHKYEVRVENEGTDRERLLIFKRQQNVNGLWSRVWGKPMVIGG